MRLAHVPMKSTLVVAMITGSEALPIPFRRNMPWPAGNAPFALGFHAMKAVLCFFFGGMDELARLAES
jgi:hypothetical protein